MLSDDEKSLMQNCLRALREHMPGFATRRVQLTMMAEVAHALASIGREKVGAATGDRIAVIEAGTGIGKTVGYLLPAIALAHARGCKLVVSSSTVALQEQLMAKDLPALQAHLPLGFRCAVAKGRRRYVCPAKLLASGAQRPVLGDGGEGGDSPESHSMRLEGRLAQAFQRGTWSGDRDDWPAAIPDGLWQRLSTDRQGCLGTRCPEYARCPFQAARQRLQEADVLVANHDLMLSAMEMEPGVLLPNPAETMFVLDEAHGLPAKAIGRGASRHSVRAAGRWIEDAATVADEAGRCLRFDRGAAAAVDGQGERVRSALSALHDQLVRHCDFRGDGTVYRFAHGLLPAGVVDRGEALREAAVGLRDAMTAARDAALERAQRDAATAQPYVAAIGSYLGHAEQLIATWDGMLQPRSETELPMARWVERGGHGARDTDLKVCAAPIGAGPRLRRLLWDQVGAAVLTSATMRGCGSFDMFLEEAGLDTLPGVRLMSLPSPFAYETQAELHLPAMCAHPRDVAAHTEEVVRRLPALLDAQPGALVLFASARQMHQVAQALPDALRSEIMVQGSLSKRQLLEQHRARIDQGLRSVLFGLASLSEGVDLPGRYCTHVIIAKLAFGVPDDPVEQARREWIEDQGRSAFDERSLPEAGIRLAQAVGRLLRTPQDHGTVTVLDPRLGTTAWGRRLLAGLPPFRIVRGRRAAA
ncbi:ATP-dependent DNA helicase DinG [Burkholderia vietnamiensis]|uniref:ATP-dependent DNA helicase DinG n=1 Tax=Burkholderia vietnamiensis TaxID=60552 RepID=UPI001D14DB57|nr:ATP-dependent DNA helicase DinG [Burkholderia vietnamiensis]UEC01665.1 ATP-dependent DNA helicase DinG [Burkholderia vietnamiensis]